MKKIATILMLVAVVLVGGMSMEAKTTKKKAKAKTSQTSKKSSAKLFCKFQVSHWGKLTVYKKANGDYFVKEDKPYGQFYASMSNGAYLIDYLPSVAHGSGTQGVIYGNRFYEIASGMYDNYENYGDIGSGSFNPSNMTLTYVNFNDRRKTVKITDYKSYPATLY